MSGSSRAGFTLLEAAVALVIISLVAVGLLSHFAAELRFMDRGRDALVRSALARDRLDAIRLLPDEGRALLPDSLREGRFRPPLDRYTWRAGVRPSREGDDLLEVRVEVDGPGGVERLVSRLHDPRRILEP